MKIIYIAGLGHSGSTILDMALGCNRNMVGLGEVLNILKGSKSELQNQKFYNDIFCSCGQTVKNCDFWKNAKKEILETTSSYPSSYEKYSAIIRYFKKAYGDDMILIDSSKNCSSYLTEINQHFDFKVIHLIRDMRSWCYSRYSRLGTSYFKLAYQWYKGNIQILRFLKKNKFNYHTFGYEEIALYPSEMLKKICDFIGTDYTDLMLVPDKTHSHVFNGNVAKGDKNKRKGIIYDARWLTSLSMPIYSTLFFPLMIFNQRLVYSNFMRGKTFAFNTKQQDFLIFGDKEKEKLLKQNWGIK